MKENLALRMYFFVNYQLSGIQKAIQAGHAALEYAYLYGEDELFKDFMKNHKTWIILNGGTTCDGETEETRGSLNNIERSLFDYNNNIKKSSRIKYSTFREPDLNNALTAICFICDERVFDLEKYIDEELEIPDYREWIFFIGGKNNEFLRKLIKDKKLA